MNYFLVNLSDIWWDESGHQKFGGKIQLETVRKYSHNITTKAISPILVEFVTTMHSGTAKYKLRNGRHRVLAAMLNGQSCILARFWSLEEDGLCQEPEVY